jgi:hypothetical protein
MINSKLISFEIESRNKLWNELHDNILSIEFDEELWREIEININ